MMLVPIQFCVDFLSTCSLELFFCCCVEFFGYIIKLVLRSGLDNYDRYARILNDVTHEFVFYAHYLQ